MSNKGWLAWAVLIVVLALAGCRGTGSENANGTAVPSDGGQPSNIGEAKQPDPVTLVFYLGGGTLTDKEFEDYVARPVQQKFPHVTMQFVKRGAGLLPQDMVASGSQIDLIYTSQGGWATLLDVGLPYDLTKLIKSEKLDEAKFDPIAMDWLRSLGEPGQLLGLPFSQNGSALYYNKDLFDKFGVKYPTDGMHWDEVIDLGRRLGRTEGNVQYRPLGVGGYDKFAGQFNLSYTDPVTDAPLLDSEVWKKAATYLKTIYDLPNNEQGNYAGTDAYFNQQTLALYAGVTIYSIGQFRQMYEKNTLFNWDMVSYPNFPETAGRGMPLDVHSLILSSTSRHKELAFQVMAYLTDEENQLYASRNGRISGLQLPTLQKEFGRDLPYLEGKNVPAIFMNVASVPDKGKYYDFILKHINATEKIILNGTVDINTALRNLNELARLAIQEQKQK